MTIQIIAPDDILSIGIKNIFNYAENDIKIQKRISKLKNSVIFNVINISAVTLIFKGDILQIEIGENEQYDLKVAMTLPTMIDITKGGLFTMVKSFLLGKVKVKPIWKLVTPLTVKFIFILLPLLSKARKKAKNVKPF